MALWIIVVVIEVEELPVDTTAFCFLQKIMICFLVYKTWKSDSQFFYFHMLLMLN